MQNLIPSPTRNLTSSNGKQFALVEVGVVLFFDRIQTYYEVTHFDSRGRPFSGDVDLFEVDKLYGTPIVFHFK